MGFTDTSPCSENKVLGGANSSPGLVDLDCETVTPRCEVGDVGQARSWRVNMSEKTTIWSAAISGTIALGGELTVNRLGFGAMHLTGDGIWGQPKDPAMAIAVLRRAIELGVNFIDTADSYGPNVSEELIAEALAPYPTDLVIATKGGWSRPG